MEPERVPPAQNIDDALALIAPRHATPILWSLQARGSATAKTLATEAMPGYGLTAVYKPLERLAADGLITAGGSGDYQLSASGRALSPCSRRSPPGPLARPPRPMPVGLGAGPGSVAEPFRPLGDHPVAAYDTRSSRSTVRRPRPDHHGPGQPGVENGRPLLPPDTRPSGLPGRRPRR
ncbi:hypothetical protein NKH18_48445 [Streptomyces sp. M10(2022)]